ncbi:DUF4145 domain-containing protein [Novosphingobium sp. PASSN1]|uniref:DUF4145 domain-containing protein n=1 Tax=Novosphingobium sp. PASSN1 TaxID=2015561 RepID=UPI0025EB165E|nr:DUF4145 domain-containing protein [Novosphingobium sp. PASSN1]
MLLSADVNILWYTILGQCSQCRKCTLFEGYTARSKLNSAGQVTSLEIFRCFPEAKRASDDIPVRARNYLQQALDSRHAPDGAIMLAASAIDWMLKEKGYKDGSLYSRIEKASQDGLFTSEMRDWAHEIRLSANDPRHADEDYFGSTIEQVDQIIQFAESLGEYLFVLPARIRKWKGQAK